MMCPALRAVGQVADFSFRVLGAAALALNRKLSLPVSRMWQWWVSRSSSAVVILASPNRSDCPHFRRAHIRNYSAVDKLDDIILALSHDVWQAVGMKRDGRSFDHR